MRLPSVKPKQVIRALERAGFEKHRQTGSHLILINREAKRLFPYPFTQEK